MDAQLFETHISIVLLVGEHAYKLKKPVKTRFLDYSTRELRMAACHREVELNERLAPDVYLGVADIAGPGGEAWDHLVVMKRLSLDRCLDALVRSGADIDDYLQQVARQMSVLHASAGRSSEVSAAGGQSAVLANWEDSFAEMRPFTDGVLDPATSAEIERLVRRYITGRRELFEDRIRRGMVVDGHGDLRAENVFCLEDGPRILDCIEFSDRLRWGDVLSDVAFLAMDLERLGRPEAASKFLERYHEASGEAHPLSLEHHYIAYRAHVRAKVACLRYAQGNAASAQVADGLLRMAAEHLRRGRVRLVLVGGPPGTGKSTLAQGLASVLGWVHIRSDEVRKELSGIAATDSARAPFGEGIYSPENTESTYAELLGRAQRLLEMGHSVVLDATWRLARYRTAAGEVAERALADLVQLQCSVDPVVARARVRARRSSTTSASDADEEIAARVTAVFEPWPGAVQVGTDGDVKASLDQALRAAT